MNISDAILAAIFGAAIALLGTLVSQLCGLVSGRMEREHDTKVRRKQNLEKMVDLIAESHQWFHKLKNCRSFSEMQQCPPPFEPRTVLMVARLSFPSMIDTAARWANGYVHFYHFASENFRADSGTPLGMQLEIAAGLSPEFRKRYDAPSMLRNLLDDAIAEEAKKYQDL